MNIKIVFTNGTIKFWHWFSENAFMVGCNIIPGIFGVAVELSPKEKQAA